MDEDVVANNNQAIINAARQIETPTIIRDEITGIGVLVGAAPHGSQQILRTFIPIEPPIPTFIAQEVEVDDYDSFVRYWTEFSGIQDASPAVYVTGAAGGGELPAAVTAIFDAPGVSMDTTAAVGRGVHRLIWPLPYSDQWRIWSSMDGRIIPQREFAEIIEDRLADIHSPAAADVLEIAQSLQVNKKVAFNSGFRLADGQVQLGYEEETESHTKGSIAIPEKLTLGIPVFFRGQPYEVPVSFRYRLNDGKLSFQIAINRKREIVATAIIDVAAQLKDGIDVNPILGTPPQPAIPD